jgi:hypothetical protein
MKYTNTKIIRLRMDQSGQIGRISAYWVIDTFGRFLKITETDKIFGITFFTVKFTYVLILTKNRLGYILGDIFKNSSCHPGMDVCMYVNSTASVMVQVIGLATTTFI